MPHILVRFMGIKYAKQFPYHNLLVLPEVVEEFERAMKPLNNE